MAVSLRIYPAASCKSGNAC